MSKNTAAQQFTLRLQALPVPNDSSQGVQAQHNLYARHHAGLLREFSARTVHSGDTELLIFPDRSGALNITPALHATRPYPAVSSYRPLTPFEVESHLWKHREVQGAVLTGQRPVDDASFWATRNLLQHDFLPYTGTVLDARSFQIHGHARQLIQCSARIDARTEAETTTDDAENQRQDALGTENRQEEKAGVALLRMATYVDPNPDARPAGAAVIARRAYLDDRYARPHLDNGQWLNVTFHLAYVEDRGPSARQGNDAARNDLFLLHPRLGYGRYSTFQTMLRDLGRCTRAEQTGVQHPWPHDYRDWFAGRKHPADPYSGQDFG